MTWPTVNHTSCSSPCCAPCTQLVHTPGLYPPTYLPHLQAVFTLDSSTDMVLFKAALAEVIRRLRTDLCTPYPFADTFTEGTQVRTHLPSWAAAEPASVLCGY